MIKNTAVITITTLFIGLCFGVYSVIFPLYLDYKGLSLKEMGILFSLASLIVPFIRIYAGAKSDYHGRKLVYSITILFYSIGYFLIAFSQKLYHFFIGNLFKRIGDDTGDAVWGVMIQEISNKKSFIGRIIGIFSIATSIGGFVTGYLIIKAGYEKTFLLLSGICFLCFLVFQLFKEERTREKAKKLNLLEIFDIRSTSRSIKLLGLTFLLTYASYSALKHFITQLYLVNILGASTVFVSSVFGLSGLMYGLAAFLGGKLLDFFQPQKIYLVTSFIVFPVTLLIGFFKSLIVVAFFIILRDSLAGLSQPACYRMSNLYAQKDRMARDFNLSRSFSIIGNMIGPLIAGFLGTYSFQLVFIFAAFFYFFTGLVLMRLK